jgi:hypothetical protein
VERASRRHDASNHDPHRCPRPRAAQGHDRARDHVLVQAQGPRPGPADLPRSGRLRVDDIRLLLPGRRDWRSRSTGRPTGTRTSARRTRRVTPGSPSGESTCCGSGQVRSTRTWAAWPMRCSSGLWRGSPAHRPCRRLALSTPGSSLRSAGGPPLPRAAGKERGVAPGSTVNRPRQSQRMSAPRLRRFSTKFGWARRMGSALMITERPSTLAATIKRAMAARMM